MKRREDWSEQMNVCISASRARVFAWGTFDCCMFIADCVRAMSAEDFAADFRGQYDDAASAYQALKEFAGGADKPLGQTLTLLAARHGWEKRSPLHAQRGDILMLPSDVFGADARFGGVLGLCVGPLFVVAAEKGLLYASMKPWFTRERADLTVWHFD